MELKDTLLMPKTEFSMRGNLPENEKLQRNLQSIDEINSYLDTVKNSSDPDHYIFSPRKEENVFKDKIELYENEKQILERAYNEYLDLKKSNLWGNKKYF